MLNLDQYNSLGAALRDALDRWPNEICLIESDRDREKTRLTYSDFKDIALPLARALQDAELRPGDRAAIIMTNQSKWLISAYAVFYGGGVLVPLDYKLTAAEQLQLLAHCQAKFLIVEYYLWRAHYPIAGVQESQAQDRAGDGGAFRRRTCRRLSLGGISPQRRSRICSAAARGHGLHCLFLGHGRPAQGMCAHPRKLPGAVQIADRLVSVLAGRALSEHSAHESRHRFHGRFHRPFCVRRLRGASAHTAAGVRARCFRSLQDHLRQLWFP